MTTRKWTEIELNGWTGWTDERMNGMNGWTDERMKWTNRRKIQTEETEENTRPPWKTLHWPQTNFTADLFNLLQSGRCHENAATGTSWPGYSGTTGKNKVIRQWNADASSSFPRRSMNTVVILDVLFIWWWKCLSMVVWSDQNSWLLSIIQCHFVLNYFCLMKILNNTWINGFCPLNTFNSCYWP
jgi:hypothetical protein